MYCFCSHFLFEDFFVFDYYIYFVCDIFLTFLSKELLCLSLFYVDIVSILVYRLYLLHTSWTCILNVFLYSWLQTLIHFKVFRAINLLVFYLQTHKLTTFRQLLWKSKFIQTILVKQTRHFKTLFHTFSNRMSSVSVPKLPVGESCSATWFSQRLLLSVLFRDNTVH